MNLSGFKRVKHGHIPGDVSKGAKIDMKEGRDKGGGVKDYIKQVTSKTRAVGKERAKKEINNP